MTPRPLPLTEFPDAVRRNVDPASPPPLRLMAARGLVPVAPEHLLMVLYQLTHDGDEPVRLAAKKTLSDSPDEVLLPGLRGTRHAEVIDTVVRANAKRGPIVEFALQHPTIDDSTVQFVARVCDERTTELIATNEVRILRSPAIIEALFMNEHARTSTIDRLLDLARRNGVTFEGLPALQALVEDVRYDPSKSSGDDSKFAERLKQSVEESEREEAAMAGLSEREQEQKRQEQLEENEQEERKSKNRAAAIMDMSISEKVRLATLGSGGDRDILILDNNRLVHMAAAQSPKVQKRDVLAWSKDKRIPDNVIQWIANSNKYRKIYQVLHNLCFNPKTPLRVASKLIPSLHQHDLKQLVRSRAVAPPVKRFAKNLMEQREKGRR